MSTQEDFPFEEVLFEFRRVGNAIKVSAIEPISNTEITMVAPINADKETMVSLAKRKLAYVMNKNKKSI